MTLSPGVWIRLGGDAFDLEQVAEAMYDPPDVRFAEEDGAWWLSCSDFEQKSGDALRGAAQKTVTALNGVAQVHWKNHIPIYCDNTAVVVNDSGVRKQTIVFVGIARESDRAGIITPRGGIPERVPSEPVRWLRLARADEDVALVMEIMGDPEPSWSALYVVLEVVRTNVNKALDAAGLVDENNRLERFDHTANNRRTLGHQARHGDSSFEAPRNPMPYGEARALAHTVVEKWLNDMRPEEGTSDFKGEGRSGGSP